MSEPLKPCADRIDEYLCSGGLFNPEQMEHEKVRNLLIACREELNRRAPTERDRLVEKLIEASRAVDISTPRCEGKCRCDMNTPIGNLRAALAALLEIDGMGK